MTSMDDGGTPPDQKLSNEYWGSTDKMVHTETETEDLPTSEKLAVATVQERRATVNELARKFELGLFGEDTFESRQRVEQERMGRELIGGLKTKASDLKGRCVGRNADDAQDILDGLVALEEQWQKREENLHVAVEEVRAALASLQEATIAAEREIEAEREMAKRRVVDGMSEANHEVEMERQRTAEVMARQHVLDREIEDARRVQALHGTSTVAELQGLAQSLRGQLVAAQAQLDARSAEAAELRKQLESALNAKAPADQMKLGGEPVLGGTLRVIGNAALRDAGTLQWNVVGKGGAVEPIAGATRPQYAPEPRDVGRMIACTFTPRGAAPGEESAISVATTEHPIASSAGLSEYCETLEAKGGGEFLVNIVQMNGDMQDREAVYVLEVTPDKVKMKKNGKTKHKESYSADMQVCGARGGGDAAALGLFLALKPKLIFMLACESARERNAAVMLIRSMASSKGLSIGGPGSM
mmetsp:Transcript_62778/g.198836  ORF Transcript_62778/g.198836 Transcript_62778/m.198836 type:complete len:473 (+) Transcript_62778:208-1626(+)